MYKKLLLLFVFLSSALPLEAQRGTTSSKRSIRRQLEQQIQQNKAAEKMLSTQVSTPAPPEKKSIKKEKPFWTRERIVQAGVGAAGLVLLMGGGSYAYKKRTQISPQKSKTDSDPSTNTSNPKKKRGKEKPLTIGKRELSPEEKEKQKRLMQAKNEKKKLINAILNGVIDAQPVEQSDIGNQSPKITTMIEKYLNQIQSKSLNAQVEFIQKKLYPEGLEGKQEE